MSNALAGRNMFIWRLVPVINVEMGVENFVRKAKAAGLSGVWIKVADGDSAFVNVKPPNAALFKEVRDGLRAEGISVWGWQVPYGGSVERAKKEATVCADLATRLELDGVLMDAEGGGGYFSGGAAEAEAYASTLKEKLPAGLGLAMCGNDIPTNFPNYPFKSFVKHAAFNAPQVYYGGSPSVLNRLARAIEANKSVKVPFIPVGAAWIGTGDGGCASASACAERAREFIRLVKENEFEGYGFWHWMGAPAAFWEVLFEVEA